MGAGGVNKVAALGAQLILRRAWAAFSAFRMTLAILEAWHSISLTVHALAP
jgi:hypothetical protein